MNPDMKSVSPRGRCQAPSVYTALRRKPGRRDLWKMELLSLHPSAWVAPYRDSWQRNTRIYCETPWLDPPPTSVVISAHLIPFIIVYLSYLRHTRVMRVALYPVGLVCMCWVVLRVDGKASESGMPGVLTSVTTERTALNVVSRRESN